MTAEPDDTAEMLADADALGRIRAAMSEAAAGDVLNEAELRRVLASRESRADEQS